MPVRWWVPALRQATIPPPDSRFQPQFLSRFSLFRRQMKPFSSFPLAANSFLSFALCFSAAQNEALYYSHSCFQIFFPKSRLSVLPFAQIFPLLFPNSCFIFQFQPFPLFFLSLSLVLFLPSRRPPCFPFRFFC